jgi:peptidyl-prolyl cis-trans isomerase A (cyclophilin A)
MVRGVSRYYAASHRRCNIEIGHSLTWLVYHVADFAVGALGALVLLAAGCGMILLIVFRTRTGASSVLPERGERRLRRVATTVFGLVSVACTIACSSGADRPRAVSEQSATMSPDPLAVTIDTDAGPIVVQLDPADAPRTTAFFLSYVDEHAYDGGEMYAGVNRWTNPNSSVEYMVGGRGLRRALNSSRSIRFESSRRSGLHNISGTIAMRQPRGANFATSEFIINVGNDIDLDADNPDADINAVFGEVIQGTNVVRNIEEWLAVGPTFRRHFTIRSVSRTPPGTVALVPITKRSEIKHEPFSYPWRRIFGLILAVAFIWGVVAGGRRVGEIKARNRGLWWR